LEFRLLGPVEALRDGSVVPIGGAKPRALLALLLLRANEVVPRDELVEALWPERPPGASAHSLDVQVSRLRKAFEPDELVMTRSGGYVLEVDPEDVDAHVFERLLDEGRRENAAGRPTVALEVLDRAVALWRGAPLADVAYEEFAHAEVRRLEELRLAATEEQIDARLALGRHEALVPEIEALLAKHPLRERLVGQLMLALYRSGRQAEALRAYADARRRLVEEVGIEPAPQLQRLEQAILRQDPALDGPPPPVTKKRRALVGVPAVVLAAATTAVVVGLTQGGTESARALAAADSNVFLDANGGEIARSVPVRNTELVRYGAGSLWSVSSDGELLRIDPDTGDVVATIGLGQEPDGLAFGLGSVWVTARHSPTLFRIDPSVNEVVDRFALPMNGVVTNLTGEVAVGSGSVWVGHGAFNPGAWVERLDPATGKSQARVSILGGDVDHLAFGEGGLWVASTAAGELRKIDPRTNKVVLTRTLASDLCCVAAGGGYVWAATNPSGDVWKVARNGAVRPTIALSSAVQRLTYADGALWATLGGSGTAVRVDPTTNALRRYAVGHFVTGVDVHHGLVALGVRQSAEDAVADLHGDVVWIGRKAPTLFDSGAATDPAFTMPTWDAPQVQFHYATCARLLNYPDSAGVAGRTLVPEVAQDVPRVSDGGRTYTFAIRPGFAFSPPSTEEVTAESFRRSLERALSPTFDYVVPEALNIVGVDEYRARKADHISGVSASAGKLVVRLRKPDPSFPWFAAMSCAVPVRTPVVANGLTTPVPSAGPYYLAEHTESFAVLRRNPNYGGSRPQHLDAIIFTFNVDPGQAAARIGDGRLDYFLESQNPTLTPDTKAAHVLGRRYALTPASSAGVQLLAFNTERPLFSSARMRRAVEYGLDRRSLAETVGLPETRLLGPFAPRSDGQLYPERGDLARARELAGTAKRPVVVYTWVDPPETDAFNRALREQLGAIGLRATILPMVQGDTEEGWLAKARRADLIWGGLNTNTGDLAAYLRPLFLPARDAAALRRVSALPAPARERAAATLARRIDRESLFAVYATAAVPELVSRRLGCIVHNPVYAGVDLAALCVKR
jgi:DNA-binding SARP family transcriptional activator/ABC-type transport system substrate-binding protein/streptogramin lyase